jgi:acetylcholinesterase
MINASASSGSRSTFNSSAVTLIVLQLWGNQQEVREQTKHATLLTSLGGSVELQLTAYGGLKPVPFQQAIPQSPGFYPASSTFLQENTTQTFLALLNVTTIEEARKLPSEKVIEANFAQVAESPWGTFTYGPVPDGVFIPTWPALLFNAGAFAQNISVLSTYSVDEGMMFTPFYLTTEQGAKTWLASIHPGAEDGALDYVLQVLYPPIYNGIQPYRSILERLALILTESCFTCNIFYMNMGYKNQTYSYEFQILPAFHGADSPYNWYNGQTASAGFFPRFAEELQEYFVNFVTKGNPNGNGLPFFPIHGVNATINSLRTSGWVVQADPTSNSRCAWWQTSLV